MPAARPVIAAVLFVLVGTPAAPGAVHYLTPADDWFDVLNGAGLQPGDEVILAAGVYSDVRRMSVRHQGTEAAPIVIRAAEGAVAVITRPDANQNVMNIEGARYLALRDVEVTGGSHGIRINKNASGDQAKFITIERCHVHHVGGPAITCNQGNNVYEGMVFRRNHIHHTSGYGEGFYLGNDSGTSPFFDAVVEKNYIHDLPTGDGIELKQGCYNTIVRDNVIHDVHLPGVIVHGAAGGGRNLIERNVIWNIDDNGIQATADAVIRNNLVFNTGGDLFNSHDKSGAVVGNFDLLHNTFISEAGGIGVRISAPAGGVISGPVNVANNAVHADSPFLIYAAGVNRTGNVVSTDLSADFADAGNHDAFPIPGSALIGAGNVAYVVVEDFNGTPRGGVADAGAYLYDPNGNPGWEIAPGFKVIPIPAGDANVDGCVDGLDYVIWGNNYLTGTIWKQANFNDDSITDGLDYIIWSNNYLAGCPGVPGAVPEPATLSLLAVGWLALIRRRSAQVIRRKGQALA